MFSTLELQCRRTNCSHREESSVGPKISIHTVTVCVALQIDLATMIQSGYLDGSDHGQCAMPRAAFWKELCYPLLTPMSGLLPAIPMAC